VRDLDTAPRALARFRARKTVTGETPLHPTPAERAARLRATIAQRTIAIPGAINALSARLIEASGF